MKISDMIHKEKESIKREVEKANREIEDLQKIEPDLMDIEFDSLFLHPLYGSAGSIRFGEQRWAGYCNATQKDTLFAAQLIDILPPIPMIEYRDSCLSFRIADGLNEREEIAVREAHATATPIFPIIGQLDQTGHGPANFQWEWFTRLPSGVVLNVEVVMLPEHHPVEYDIAWSGHIERDSRRIIRCNITGNNNFPGAFFIDKRAKFHSGSNDSPNCYVIYWTDQDEEDIRLTFTESLLGMELEAVS